jgi:hypothetical protein
VCLRGDAVCGIRRRDLRAGEANRLRSRTGGSSARLWTGRCQQRHRPFRRLRDGEGDRRQPRCHGSTLAQQREKRGHNGHVCLGLVIRVWGVSHWLVQRQQVKYRHVAVTLCLCGQGILTGGFR